MTGASFVGPNPIPPLWWKSSCTSCGSCAGGYVGLQCSCSSSTVLWLASNLDERYVTCSLCWLSTLEELYGTCSPAAALDSALLVGRNSEKRKRSQLQSCCNLHIKGMELHIYVRLEAPARSHLPK